MKITGIACVTVALSLTACATPPEKIQAAYISPLEYQSYDCGQLSQELQRVTDRANETAGVVQKDASHDNTSMAVAAILFWPALFFVHGNGPEAVEFAALKGRRDAIEQEGIAKHCALPKLALAIPKPPPPPPQKNPF